MIFHHYLTMCGKYLPVFYMCILINYLSVDILTDDSVPYWYVWKTFNWTEADRHCKSANGSLVRITDQNYMQIRQCVGTSRAWTGAHTKLLPEDNSWIEHIGCFNSSLKEDSPENTILPNSPQQCRVNCQDGRFFAVQENKCFCLNGSANTWNEFRKRAGNCTYICNGNSKYFCGGSDSVNIYGHVSDVKIKNQRLECIFTECVENGTFGWNKSEQSCGTSDRNITTICDDGTFVTNTSSATDNDSRKWCSKRNAYLWSPGTGILDCNNSTIHEAINGTWIRINTFMSLSLRWNFTDGSSQCNPLKCFTLMSSVTNSVLKEEDCVEKFHFICQAGMIIVFKNLIHMQKHSGAFRNGNGTLHKWKIMKLLFNQLEMDQNSYTKKLMKILPQVCSHPYLINNLDPIYQPYRKRKKKMRIHLLSPGSMTNWAILVKDI
ncbi:hypothetical protein KUTeg_015341 [Tegillarca granosa]|uniref:WSC domain-containing protein n=1 Tax=Tegillarca granosa TaxID=220873 RepID=A0ABQ9EUK0_TEGGR|nr:hypothetical protein KUTeg_015341 [Tegillarca granosa]